TSKQCSRCGTINDVNGKKFVCSNCGHKDHRDANAGFNIGKRYLDGITGNQRMFSAGHIDVAQTGKGEDKSYV
ncbi:MAG: zinc ribbon domain-containing protein, partial [Nanoarchaeota archaeon]